MKYDLKRYYILVIICSDDLYGEQRLKQLQVI